MEETKKPAGQLLLAPFQGALVILESPYAGDVAANVEYARRCVRDSLMRGEAPIASHLLYTQPGILRDEVPDERKRGIDAGLAWRTVAQRSVVYIDRGISDGMRYGIAAARAAGIPVQFREIDRDIEVPAEMLAERQRQVEVEGYSAEHDDAHDGGEMLAVASMYWQRAIGGVLLMTEREGHEGPLSVPVDFPWDPDWWKPRTPSRDLERAGALCLAEIDRLKRRFRPVFHVDGKLRAIAAAYVGLKGARA